MDIDYRRWWALAVDLAAAHPGADPVLVVAAELARQLDARGVALVDVGPPLAVRPVGPPCSDPVDVRWYVTRTQDIPVVAVLRGSRRTVPLATATARWAPREVARRTASDGVGALVGLPLSGRAARTWLVVLRAQPFGLEELDLVDHVHRLLLAVQGVDDHVTAGEGVLTARERAVLELMAEGLVAEAIGRRLGVSPRTVSKHQEHIYRKLAAPDRLSAVLRAQAAGLLTASS